MRLHGLMACSAQRRERGTITFVGQKQESAEGGLHMNIDTSKWKQHQSSWLAGTLPFIVQ